MARTIFIFLILALVTLAILPNPQSGLNADSKWANIQPFEKAGPSILEKGLSLVGLNIPGELMPGLGIIVISMLVGLLKKSG